jgi:fructose-bisphosphate aldolase class I
MSKTLNEIARALVSDGRGILAADESTGTIGKRLASIDVENTEDNRRGYRELLFTTNGASEFVSGVILYDETIRQSAKDGKPFPKLLSGQNIIPGIKVDAGAKPLSNHDRETVTEGLDGLRDRVKEYHELGARFAKWRAVISIADGIPSAYCIEANAHALARYAAICQEGGLVPIVEPEVLMDGTHSLERNREVTTAVHHETFNQLYKHGVDLGGVLLKPNMIISGNKCEKPASVEDIADATVATFLKTVPAAVPGIVFLSGGQSETQATKNLNAMNARHRGLPWKLSFSYGRALQQSALKAWLGKADSVEAAQAAYLHRARMNSAARNGKYSADLEGAA